MIQQKKQGGITVFFSYAQADRALRDQLAIHLSLLKRNGLIEEWSDQQIPAGADRVQEIDQTIRRARIILLLISANFLASDTCYQVEMQQALERHRRGEARVIPIILRPCDWHTSPFASLQSLPRNGKAVTEWSNRDKAFTDISTGIRRAIEALSLLTASAPRADLPAIWNIPYSRNPFFTGRDELLSQLHNQLLAGQPAALSQPQAISGLGGIGKTQLAVEYAYRYCQEYEVVLWASAESQETLTSSYRTIATLLELPVPKATEQEMTIQAIEEITIQAVKTWLQSHRDWLLILDNADEPDQLIPFLPASRGGHLLVTTRASDLSHLGLGFSHSLVIKTFPPEQGTLFLLHRTGLLTQEAGLEQAPPQDRALAKQIGQELGWLPLALDQAGAYINATKCSLATYQQIYQQHHAQLLGERRGYDHPEPVATTWSLSFRRVEEKNLAAGDLLRLVVSPLSSIGFLLNPPHRPKEKMRYTFTPMASQADS